MVAPLPPLVRSVLILALALGLAFLYRSAPPQPAALRWSTSPRAAWKSSYDREMAALDAVLRQQEEVGRRQRDQALNQRLRALRAEWERQQLVRQLVGLPRFLP